MVEVIADELRVCATCALFLANGECEGCESCIYPANCPEAAACLTVADRIAEHWPVGSLVLACTEHDECDSDYSTSPCDGCGSELHGMRHSAAVLSA